MIKQIYKKNKVYFSLVLILFVILIMSLIFPAKQYKVDLYENKNQDTVGKIYKTDFVQQSFVASKNYNSFGIPIATYSEILNKGKLYVSINDGKKEKKFIINLNSVIDNQYVYFKYKLIKNKNYKISLATRNNNKPITFITTDKKYNGATLVLNGEAKNYNIKLGFRYNKNSYYTSFYILFILVLFITYGVLNIEIGEDKK